MKGCTVKYQGDKKFVLHRCQVDLLQINHILSFKTTTSSKDLMVQKQRFTAV